MMVDGSYCKTIHPSIHPPAHKASSFAKASEDRSEDRQDERGEWIRMKNIELIIFYMLIPRSF